MNNNSNKFLSGFLWGAVIGGAAVFLLNTDKGKKLLKLISERGLGNIEELIEESQEDEGVKVGNKSEGNKKETNGEVVHNGETENRKPSVKRFFKGIHKRIHV